MLSIRVSRRIEPARFVKPESPPELIVCPNSPECGRKQEYEFSLITGPCLTRVEFVVASNELRLYSELVGSKPSLDYKMSYSSLALVKSDPSRLST